MLAAGLVWFSLSGTGLMATGESPLSATDDVVNDRTAARARCLRLGEEVLTLLARHHISDQSRSDWERSLATALRGPASEVPDLGRLFAKKFFPGTYQQL